MEKYFKPAKCWRLWPSGPAWWARQGQAGGEGGRLQGAEDAHFGHGPGHHVQGPGRGSRWASAPRRSTPACSGAPIQGATSGISRWRRSKLYEAAPYLTVDPTLPFLEHVAGDQQQGLGQAVPGGPEGVHRGRGRDSAVDPRPSRPRKPRTTWPFSRPTPSPWWT